MFETTNQASSGEILFDVTVFCVILHRIHWYFIVAWWDSLWEMDCWMSRTFALKNPSNFVSFGQSITGCLHGFGVIQIIIFCFDGANNLSTCDGLLKSCLNTDLMLFDSNVSIIWLRWSKFKPKNWTKTGLKIDTLANTSFLAGYET